MFISRDVHRRRLNRSTSNFHGLLGCSSRACGFKIHTPALRYMSKKSTVEESIFNHTSRRWIFNEDARLRERYVRFDVEALQRVAARAVSRNRCINIIKMAEGGFNKVFLLTMEDGYEIIARIPTPVAGPHHFTTASEVANLRFLRDVLQIPVPKVFAYSTSATNPVGAEYIIMERLYGDNLASRWLSLSTAEVKEIMSQIVDIEEKLFSFTFPAYGSLYYRRDVPEVFQISVIAEKSGNFCAGPISKRQFWHGERETMQVDRGPWTKAEDFLTAAARRELSWISKYAITQPRKTFLLQTNEEIDPREHAALLSDYILMAPSLVPKKLEFRTPMLRHPDLSFANILLVPNSTKIRGIIDWQDAAILPLFAQAGYPAFCKHDMSKVQSLKRPKLPDDFESMSSVEKEQVISQFRLEEANVYYTAATGLKNQLHLRALQLRHVGLIQHLLMQTGFQWDADFINLKAALVGITRAWGDISSQPCPISFSPEEQEKALNDASEWNESATILSTVRDSLGIDDEGGTEPENYEYAREMNQRWRLEMLAHADDHEKEICWNIWPNKDDDDCSIPPKM